MRGVPNNFATGSLCKWLIRLWVSANFCISGSKGRIGSFMAGVASLKSRESASITKFYTKSAI